jgi:broad specificity phosphatase PhoE
MNYVLICVFLASTVPIIIKSAAQTSLDSNSIVVCLVRHGQTDLNKKYVMQGHTDQPMNTKGRTQIQRLATKLQTVPFSAYYSSDLQRAIESAHILTQSKPMPIQIDPRLRERNYGSWEGSFGLTYGLSPSKYKKDVESPENMRQRIFSFLQDITKQYQGQYVLVVAHGGVIDTILRTILAHPFKMFRIPNGSLTCIVYQEGQWQLLPEQKLYDLCCSNQPLFSTK